MYAIYTLFTEFTLTGTKKQTRYITYCGSIVYDNLFETKLNDATCKIGAFAAYLY